MIPPSRTPIRPASARTISSRKSRSPGSAPARTSARRPKRPSKKIVSEAPTLQADLKVISSKPTAAWRRLLKKNRKLLSWALLLGVAILDPGLIFALLMVAAATAASLFALGVIATALTTVALLNAWRPGRYGRILRRPPQSCQQNNS